MEIKFTPWRMHYITKGTGPAIEGCVLCGLHQAASEQDAQNLVLYRGEHCYVVLNLYPYNTAHVMVVPYLHTADLPGLDGAIGAELFRLVQRSVAIIGGEYQPHGFNVGLNLGRVAGAGIEEHLHMHIVPRWGGDSNFMPIIAGTKLIPETLDITYGRLIGHFRSG
jgi:ATP adenylyltransferase